MQKSFSNKTIRSSIKTLIPNTTDNFTNYVLSWVNENLTSLNGLPKYSPHLEIIELIEIDYQTGKFLIGVKCSLKWVDYRFDMKIDEESYPFEPKLIIKHVIKRESEVKTGAQVINVIRLQKATLYTMEKTYYWTLWLPITNRISIFSPFTKCIMSFELGLIKFTRTYTFASQLKNKLSGGTGEDVSTSKEYYGEFGTYKSSFRVFEWLKLDNKKNIELTNINKDDKEIEGNLINVSTDKDYFFKIKETDIKEIYLSTSIEGLSDLINKDDHALILRSSTYPYISDENRLTKEISCNGELKEQIHNRGYKITLEFRRNKVLFDLLNVLPIWFIVLYHIYSDLSISDFISLLFSMIAYKFTLMQNFNESKHYNFTDIILFFSMVLNMVLSALKNTDYESSITYISIIYVGFSLSLTLSIFIRHMIKTNEITRSRAKTYDGRIPFYMDSQKRTNSINKLSLIHEKLLFLGCSPSKMPKIVFDSMNMQIFRNISMMLNKYFIDKSIFFDLKKESSIVRKMKQKRKLHDIIRTRIKTDKLIYILEDLCKIFKPTNFDMDLDILTFREPDNALIAKLYLTSSHNDVPTVIEIQICELSEEMIVQLSSKRIVESGLDLSLLKNRARRQSEEEVKYIHQ